VLDRTSSHSAAVGFILCTAAPLLAVPAWAEPSSPAEPATDAIEDSAEDSAEAEAWLQVESAEAYVVEAEAPTVPPPGVEIAVEPGPYAADLASQIDAAPGARAVRSGGLLAPSELRVRGLGGARLAVTLDGIPLDDPAGGRIDLTELESGLISDARLLRGPEAGTLAPGAVAGTLALRTAAIEQGLRAQLRSMAGSEGTARFSTRLGYGSGGAGVLGSLLLGRSEGDFSYRPVSYSGDQPYVGDPQRRANNDHARYGASLLARYAGEGFLGQGLVHLARHTGGVAGLAGHPSPEARFSSESALAGTRLTTLVGPAEVGAELSARRREAHFINPTPLATAQSHEQLNTTRGAITIDAPLIHDRAKLSLAVEASRSEARPVLGDRAFVFDQEGEANGLRALRDAVAARARLRVELLERRLAVDVGARLDQISDVGLEPSASAQLSAALTRDLVLDVSAGRAFRAPTFYEKYGPPLGYVRANPDLQPEDGVEVGAGLRFGSARAAVATSLFVARLSHAILYLNRNAYEVRPENAGSLWRGGGELSASLRATRWLTQRAVVELLLSRLDATGAAVPTSPLLRLRSRTELSIEALWSALPLHAFLDAAAASPSSSNLHGELTVPAQATLDAGLALQISEHSSLSLELRNLLDADSRVDLHQVPLPGRQLMASLVLGA